MSTATGYRQSARPFGRPVDWLRLDNAARIYVAMMGSRSPTAFRIAVATAETVDALLLQKALDAVMPRFPYFGVGLRHGLFWHFLQKIEATPQVQVESGPPCADFTGRGHLFRVMHYGKRISAEFSHVLSDGVGALAFTRSPSLLSTFNFEAVVLSILPICAILARRRRPMKSRTRTNGSTRRRFRISKRRARPITPGANLYREPMLSWLPARVRRPRSSKSAKSAG